MFKFKGNRNYLHGTDFYQHTQLLLAQQFADLSHISAMSFRRFARNQCVLVTTQPDATAIIPCQGEAIRHAAMPVKFWWVETEEPLTARYEYDEDGLVAAANVTDTLDYIALARPDARYCTIEVIVALTKKLHYLKSPNIDGKWVFGQLNLSNSLPIQYQTVSISLKTYFEGRFSVSDIIIDNISIGTIRFIVGQP